MGDYIKFWFAKELAGLLIFGGIVLLFVFAVCFVAISEQIKRWKLRKP